MIHTVIIDVFYTYFTHLVILVYFELSILYLILLQENSSKVSYAGIHTQVNMKAQYRA